MNTCLQEHHKTDKSCMFLITYEKNTEGFLFGWFRQTPSKENLQQFPTIKRLL